MRFCDACDTGMEISDPIYNSRNYNELQATPNGIARLCHPYSVSQGYAMCHNATTRSFPSIICTAAPIPVPLSALYKVFAFIPVPLIPCSMPRCKWRVSTACHCTPVFSLTIGLSQSPCLYAPTTEPSKAREKRL